jgi:ribosomal protein S27AE
MPKQCSRCGSEMMDVGAGWLCMKCGHIEINDAEEPDDE